MDTVDATLYILKRDGSEQPFNAEKIRSAIMKAYRAGGVRPDSSRIDLIVKRIEGYARNNESEKLAVEQIQDCLLYTSANAQIGATAPRYRRGGDVH